MSNQQKAITRDDYLALVKKYKTLDDAVIANKGGWGRTTVWRFRTKYHPEVFEEAEKIIEEMENISVTKYIMPSIDVFKEIPIIAEWIVSLDVPKPVSQKYKDKCVWALYRVCENIGVHPNNLDVDLVAEHVNKWKKIKEDRDKVDELIKQNPDDKELKKQLKEMPNYPYGCSYNNLRKPLRNFYQNMIGISGKLLTSKGIGAEHSKGTFGMSDERIPISIRDEITYEYVKEVVTKYNLDNNTNWSDEDIENISWEMLALCWFQYYTGTRIDSTTDTRFNDTRNIYRDDVINIHVIDKGEGGKSEGGGIHWDKELLGDAKDLFLIYVENRHHIDKDNYIILRKYNEYIFPWSHDNYDHEVKIMREIQEGLGYYISIPNHIWRHTFAQDGLDASDRNYELIAALGGWSSVDTMKNAYGKADKASKRRGLRKIMGMPVEDITYELKFYSNNPYVEGS
jgi:hypothetical protein